MTNYDKLKVTELRELLQERNLAQTGNKPDLIKRLQENDKEKEAGGAADGAAGGAAGGDAKRMLTPPSCRGFLPPLC
jgi:SAP domain-containing ribonucleoprotein